jgi:hypothetical protein
MTPKFSGLKEYLLSHSLCKPEIFCGLGGSFCLRVSLKTTIKLLAGAVVSLEGSTDGRKVCFQVYSCEGWQVSVLHPC